MTGNPYRVLGPSAPPMLGRMALLQRIKRHLEKPSPDHVSVVGPRHYGKSVLLSHLAEEYRVGSSGYLTAAYVDLRRDPPRSDRDFKRRLAEEVKKALQPYRLELSGWIDVEDEDVHELLGLVLEELEGDDSRMLVVLDGFEYVLDRPNLTRNLWDQLRSLAQRTSLRFVTGSRLRLREICRTEESRTSNFWNIFFETPIWVAALDHDDWTSFLQPLLDTECQLDDSARKEITNWTGGVPLLVCGLLQELWDRHRGARISRREIDATAETILEGRRELLQILWEDCDVDLRSDLGALDDADIPLPDISDDRRRALEERGYGRLSRNRIRGSCRLIQRYARQQAPALTNLTRLFGTASGFETHIGPLLELRLKQSAGENADSTLRNYVNSAIKKIDDPEISISGIRGIVERALLLIWNAELPPDRTLPTHWLDEWRHGGVRKLPEDRGKLPRPSGSQCYVLRLITGTKRISPHSQYVTKTTSLLVDHLYSVGNFGQHRGGYPETEVSVDFAAGVVLTAISLVESVTSDLQRVTDSGGGVA